MIKLLKYLKPYAGLAVACVCMVFLQAICDLKLPDYMSDIVNIGVQRYGIEDAVPYQMRSATFEKLRLLMGEEQQKLAMECYREKDEGVILRTDITKEQRQQLSDAMEPGFMVLAALNSTDPQLQLPEGVDPFAMLQTMNETQRQQMLQQMTEGLSSMGSAVTGQMAAMAIKAEYEAMGIDTTALQRSAILRTGGKMLAVALLVCVSAIAAGYLSSRIAAGFSRDVRRDVFAKAVSFSNAEMDRFSTASLITRTTNDIQQVQQVVTMMFRMVLFAPIMGIGGIIYALRKSVSMAWIIALAVIVLLGLILIIFSIAMPRFKQLQKLIDRLNLVTRENLSGVTVSRAYNTQNFEQQRFDVANRDLTRTNLFINRVMVSMTPFMNIVMNGVTLLIIWFGAKLIAQSSLQVGDMMAYIQYAMHVVISFLFVSMMFIMIPRAAVSGDRIAQVLECDNSIVDPKNPCAIDAFPAQRGCVEFRNVSFRYPGADEDTLHDISFTAHPGEVTAFIGATGSGKTTLVNLIPRFYDVTEGQVLVNGVDVRQLRQNELRGQIGYVPQKAVLFTGTIADNIRLGAENADMAQVQAAAVTAQAAAFIGEKEGGYAEPIAQGGTNVSGGQRQRLSIARALATGAPIYIFDDSFSALDFKTDAALRRALRENAADSTMLIVAQRVGTIKHAQQIVVLDEGCVVGIGTHAELMQTCDVYQQIARSQLREEEL